MIGIAVACWVYRGWQGGLFGAFFCLAGLIAIQWFWRHTQATEKEWIADMPTK
jgi:hypothetical protein